MLYRILTTKEDFLDNFIEPEYNALTGSKLMAAIWLKNYINEANTEEIRNMTKFVTGSLRMPVHRKISVNFERSGNSRTEPEGRLPKASVCSSELMLSDQYGDEEEEAFK